jgi:hypothetical protein
VRRGILRRRRSEHHFIFKSDERVDEFFFFEEGKATEKHKTQTKKRKNLKKSMQVRLQTSA